MSELDGFTRAYQAEQEALDPARLLGVIKQETHEMSTTRAKLIPLGELRGNTDPSLWTGRSSLQERFISGEISEAEVDGAVAYANECYVPVKLAAPKRCVEDRSEEAYDDKNPVDYDEALGPQVQGGTADEAVAYRITHSPETESSIEADTEEVAHNKQSKFSPGGHTSTAAAKGKTDCGSIDHEAPKLELMADPSIAAVIEKLIIPIMELNGQKVSDSVFSDVQGGAKKLLQHSPQYFKNVFKVLDVIRKVNPGGVKTVVGEHKQVAVIINMVEGWTFHTNHYNVRSQGKLTIHNLDAWNIFKENDEPEQVALFSQAVATLMRITDGSIRLYVRMPVV